MSTIEYYLDAIKNNRFPWNDYPKSDKYVGSRITLEQVCKNWIEISLNENDTQALNVLFDKLDVPKDLDLKQRIAYYELLKD